MAGVFSLFGSLKAKASWTTFVVFTFVAVELVVIPAEAMPAEFVHVSVEDLWNNPCSTQSIRHVRSPADIELKHFMGTLRRVTIRGFKKLYTGHVGKVKGNCPKLRKLLEPIKKSQSVKEVLVNLYYAMLELYDYLVKVRNIAIDTNVPFDFDERRRIYDETIFSLRLAICEVRETMTNRYKIPLNSELKPPKFCTDCVPKRADATLIEMIDLSLSQKVNKIFKVGKTKLRTLKYIERSLKQDKKRRQMNRKAKLAKSS